MKFLHLLLASVLAGSLSAAPLTPDQPPAQTAKDTPPDGRGDRPIGAPAKATTPTGAATSGNGISYHGGPLILGTTNVYYIWYGNWNTGTGPAAVNILTNLAQSIGGSPYFNINTTYSDGSNQSVSNSVHYAGSTTDNYSRGTAISDADVQGIVSDAITSGRLPSDTNAVYFVLASADINETSGFCTQYCGWHSLGTIGGKNIKYAFIGDADRCPNSCAAQTTGPNGTTGADGMASIISHELEEAVTDPNLNAWYDSAGNENADKCAWTFGPTYAAPNGARANMNLGGLNYLIQQNWVNAAGGYCALSYSAGPDFSLSATPATQTFSRGNTAGYTVTITPSNGFTSSVNLAVSGLPTGASATFTPNPGTTSGPSTLTVTTGSTTPAGKYTLTITGTSGTLTHSTTVTLSVTDFSFSASPGTQTVFAGGSVPYTVTVTAVNGFTDTVAFSVSGLPSGITAGFSPTTIAGAGSSTMTLTANSAVAAGSYPLTVSATSGSIVHTANVTLTVTIPASGGSLTGSMAAPTGPVQLTTQGTSDWAHWGLNTASDFDHKAAVTSQISNYSLALGGAALRYTNNPVGFTWTDGTPNATATNSTTGLYIAGQNNGFRISAPADATMRTLSVYVGVWKSQGRLTAHLSDGSAADYVDATLVNSAGTTLGLYTLNYSAGTSGQTLTVTFTQMTPSPGNVTLQAATLTMGTPAPDYTVSATPATQTVPGSGTAAYTVSVSPLNGFSGTVGFNVSGLPSGATAQFSPTTVTGNGSTTMTVTVAGGTPAANYPLVVTANSGTLTHTANVTLAITDYTASATPASQTVTGSGTAAYTVSVSPLNGFNGSVGFSVSGLPSGVTAQFSPTTVTGSGSSTMTLTVGSGTVAGSYPLVITANSGTLTHTANVTLVVTAATISGTLSGSVVTPASPVQLTTEGTVDWAHWGVNTASDFDHKAAVTPQISNYTLILGGAAQRYTNNPVGFTWTDGTPNGTATNSTTGIYIAGQNNGFRITAPADTTVRTLRVYVGVWKSQARLTAHLSDGSAADYVDASLVNSAGTTVGVYTLTYKAAAAGQTLSITFTQTTSGGNVTIQAATLQ